MKLGPFGEPTFVNGALALQEQEHFGELERLHDEHVYGTHDKYNSNYNKYGELYKPDKKTMFTWIINIFRKKKKDTISIEMAMDQQIIAQVVQSPSEIVLKDSQDRINKIKIYANYFDNVLVTNILNQTEIVHDVFLNNKDLSYKKLEQFHYQYTDSLIELLQKLKTTKDENSAVISTQLKSIENKIATGKKKSNQILQGDIKKMSNEKAQYAQTMSLQLASIYNCMVDNFNDFRFKKLKSFVTYTIKTGIDLAWLLESELYLSFLKYDTNGQYAWDDFKIERKLMGRLQKHLFLIDFVGVCYSGESSFEIFTISDSDDYFMYIHELGIFKFIDYHKVQPFCTTDNTKFGNLNKEIDEFENKKVEIKAKFTDMKNIDSKTEKVMKEYLTKIEDIEMINKISEVDVERRNLQSMIDLTMLEV